MTIFFNEKIPSVKGAISREGLLWGNKAFLMENGGNTSHVIGMKELICQEVRYSIFFCLYLYLRGTAFEAYKKQSLLIGTVNFGFHPRQKSEEIQER